jgi:hypothetical protein
MFNWFKKKDESNVVKFPESNEGSYPTYVDPPEPEKPATTYYRLGMTSDNRVSLAMGYSEITMNVAGINNMIKQLECFRDQIAEHESNKEE